MSSADEISVFPACDPDDHLSAICRELCAGINDVFDNDYFFKKKILCDDPLGRPEITVNINTDWTVTQDQTNSCDRFDSSAYAESEEEDQVEDDNEDDSRIYSVRDNPAFFIKFDESSCDSVNEQIVPSSSPVSPKSDNEDVSEWKKEEDIEEEEEVDRSKRKERDGESESEDVENDDKNKDDELMRNSTAKRVHLESETETRSRANLS